MGLFSKKDYVCEKCGKTFQKRINLNGNLCDVCWDLEYEEKKQLEEAIRGYVEYAEFVLGKTYTPDEMRAIIDRRDDILDKYKNEGGLKRIDLQNASENFKSLTDDQAAEILGRLSHSIVPSTLGAVYAGSFFLPTHYEGMIVDAEDVFAVGYTTNHAIDVGTDEAILCAVFTNDPYVPVFPVIYVGKTEFFELMKSKKGRANVSAMFEAMCPNLKYPVGDIKELKKQIKQEGTVKGNVDMKFMLDQLSNASVYSGVFENKRMHSELYPGSMSMLDGMGYISDDEVDIILHMDRKPNRNYWNKQIDRVNKLG